MSYKLVVHPKALKDIQQLSTQHIQRVEKKIDDLINNPRPHGYIKMTNFNSPRLPNIECYRIRVGDVRIIYVIEEQVVTITIVQVEKRGDIY